MEEDAPCRDADAGSNPARDALLLSGCQDHRRYRRTPPGETTAEWTAPGGPGRNAAHTTLHGQSLRSSADRALGSGPGGRWFESSRRRFPYPHAIHPHARPWLGMAGQGRFMCISCVRVRAARACGGALDDIRPVISHQGKGNAQPCRCFSEYPWRTHLTMKLTSARAHRHSQPSDHWV